MIGRKRFLTLTKPLIKDIINQFFSGIYNAALDYYLLRGYWWMKALHPVYYGYEEH